MKKNNIVGVALNESEVGDYPNICVVVISFMCFMYFSHWKILRRGNVLAPK